ncbi:MOSC domain-containing protein [Nocardioides sp. Bht2]|uniref:MOSC domain-containing protein n=1 Tax=Nocardioides sp. Bht2 TaxID=3392297 RepID=UPI0039B4950E
MTEAGARIHSVNVGAVRAVPWGGRGRGTRSAISKGAVRGDVAVGRLGLAGDEQADLRHHGGPDRALYAFALEDLERWSGELGGPLAPGDFGENLTTVGIDPNAALVGEKWRIGTALVQVCWIRTPCFKFQARLGELGFATAGWLKRFTADLRPGPYLRVLEEGTLRAGDVIVVEERPEHTVSVSEMFRIVTTERERLPELLAIDALPAFAREQITAVD